MGRHLASKKIAGGLVVMFDGIDGAGKTTQLGLVHEALEDRGYNVYNTRINGGTAIGEALRNVMLSNIERPVRSDLHMMLAMHEALAADLYEQRKAGSFILIDRGSLAIAGYQIYGDGLLPELGWSAIDESLSLLKPETIIIYTLPIAVARNRSLRGKPEHKDYFESKGDAYFERVQIGYVESAQRYHGIVIDANKPQESVFQATMAIIDKALEAKDPINVRVSEHA